MCHKDVVDFAGTVISPRSHTFLAAAPALNGERCRFVDKHGRVCGGTNGGEGKHDWHHPFQPAPAPADSPKTTPGEVPMPPRTWAKQRIASLKASSAQLRKELDSVIDKWRDGAAELDQLRERLATADYLLKRAQRRLGDWPGLYDEIIKWRNTPAPKGTTE